MATTITLTYKGKDYTLGYTRRSVKIMEQRGFSIQELDSKPLTTMLELWHGAFLAKYPGISQTLTEEIYDKISGKEALIEILAESYSEPLTAVTTDPEESLGEVEWRRS